MKKNGLSWMVLAVVTGGCSSEPAAGPVVAAPAAEDAGAAVTDAGVVAPLEPSEPAPADGGAEGGGPTCTAAREQLLKPIASVSTGAVTVLSGSASAKTVFIDASAGGAQASSTSPRVYVNLETLTRVDVTDVSAPASAGWDLALKRPVLFTNGGDGGAGRGGALFLPGKEFDDVTSADAAGKTLVTERFFDDECNPQVDPTNAVKTSFDGWYDYEPATNVLTPKAGTWLVASASGKLFKVRILSYYATSDGGVGQAGGRYTLTVGAL